MDQEKLIKEVKDSWANLFENELDKADRSSYRDFYAYYQAEYDKASRMFLSQGQINSADVQVFFKESTLIKMYSEMYSKVGLQFAKWYSKNVDKLISKSVNFKDYESIWQANFAFIGVQVGGQRVTSVSGTAKQTIISVIQKLIKDPEFQIQGEKVKAKILRTQFNKFSTYQARRVVRTETTNAANYATWKSASDIFAGQDMQKMWMSGRDARVRPAHQAAHRQVVDFNKPFIVGGQALKWPGDPSGSASNVINCRCSMAPFPKPNAQTIGENITDIGFGLARTTIQNTFTEALITPEVATTIGVEAQQIELNAKKEAMRPDNWNNIVPKNAQVNDDYLVLLKDKPKMFSSTTESFAQGNNITIDIVRFDDKSMPGVLAHEFGHIIHKQQNWITRYNVDPIVDKYFKKHQKMVGVGLRGENRLKLLRDYYEKLRQMNTTEFRNLFSGLSENEYLEFRGATRDFFGALTKNVIGGGHSTSYYNNKNFDRMEWMAHIFENKYVGNPLFKKLFPEIYDETLQIIDELIANIK
jgi:hypothetical protein